VDDEDESFDLLEKEAEEHFKKWFGDDVVTAFNSLEEHSYWIVEYPKRFPPQWQQPIHE
jgi:hypothetical protein